MAKQIWKWKKDGKEKSGNERKLGKKEKSKKNEKSGYWANAKGRKRRGYYLCWKDNLLNCGKNIKGRKRKIRGRNKRKMRNAGGRKNWRRKNEGKVSLSIL